MTIHKVPEFSQHLDVKEKEWKSRACGVTALKMLLEYNNSDSPSIDELIKIGVEKDAYIPNIGWKHRELAEIARDFKLKSRNFDWANLAPEEAFKKLKSYFPENPVLASIYKDFDDRKGGHLIVLTGMENDTIFYNEPYAKKRQEIRRSVHKDKFMKGWKRRIITATR